MKINDYIYHGKRWWVQNPIGDQHQGWNTYFEDCKIWTITAKRVGILSPSLGVMYLNRIELEKNGKVYHSRPHEYFYRTKPLVDPEKSRFMPKAHESLVFLGVDYPPSRKEIEKSYKSAAKLFHPDKGGSHEDFLRLQKAYKAALGLVGK